MAREFFDNSADYLEFILATELNFPITLAAWFNSDSASLRQSALQVGNTAAAYGLRLEVSGHLTGDPVTALAFSPSAGEIATTSTGYSTGTWHHGCAVFAATNSRAAYIDGGSKGTNTNNRVTDLFTEIRIGMSGSQGTNRPFDGKIYDAAVWNASLTDAEVAALAKGISPLRIRPQSLIFYCPVYGVRSPEIEVVKGRVATVAGSPTYAVSGPNSPILLPRIWVPAAVVDEVPTIQPAGIVSTEAFGTVVVDFQTAVAPTGISSTEAFGTANVTFNATVSPGGIASAEAFGSSSLGTTFEIAPTGITSAEAFGTADIDPTFEGVVSPNGIPSAEAFGTATITWRTIVQPAGIASAEAFGTASVDNVASITTTGIPPAEAFGTAGVTWNTTVAPTAIASEEAFGNAALSFNTEIAPTGIGSAEAFGVAEVVRHSVQSITVGGIASGEAFGSAALTWNTAITPAGIASAEAFGTANLSGEIVVSPAGIASAEVFGNATVDGAGTRSLTEQDLIDIANAVWAHPKALTLARFLGLK